MGIEIVRRLTGTGTVDRRPLRDGRDGSHQPVDVCDLQAPSGKPDHRIRRRCLAVLATAAVSIGTSIAVPSNMLPAPLSWGTHAIASALAGTIDVPPPSLPAYPHLNPAEKAQAVQRGGGVSVSDPVMQGTDSLHHEPATVFVRGSVEELKAALTSQGWHTPNGMGFSAMVLDGKAPVLLLEKNDQLGGMVRDHVRVFDEGNGQLALCATRDRQWFIRVEAGGGLSFHHRTDTNIDGERDLVLHDLLTARPDASASWVASPGVRTYNNQASYENPDGLVYQISLGPAH